MEKTHYCQGLRNGWLKKINKKNFYRNLDAT